MIFLDTSGVYALADKDDQNHESALRMFDTVVRSGEEILTHSYVLVESAALLQKRLGSEIALTFLKEADSFTIRWVSPELQCDAVGYLEERRSSKISLVDAVSFLVMRRDGITEYLGFDQHFVDEGFREVKLKRG